MALPPQYRSRVNSSAAPLGQRQIARSGIAQGLTVLGREGSAAVARREQAERAIEESEARIVEREQARDRMMQGLDAGARFSEVQLTVAEQIAELEREPASGGAGHEVEVRRILSEQRTQFLGTIEDEELRARTAEQWAAFETRSMLRADTFEAAKRVEKSTTDFSSLATNGQALVYADPTVETFTEQVSTALAFIDTMEMGEDGKAQLQQEYRAGAFQSLLSGLVDSGQHAQAEALRKAPEFAGLLDYKSSQRFKGLAENAAKVEARQAELAQEEARDALRDDIDGVRALIKAGATDVGASRLAQLQSQAQAVGLKPDELVELGDWSIALEVNKRYTSVRQLNTGIRGLQEQLAAGKLDETGQIQLAHMRERRTTLLEEQGSQYKDDWLQGGQRRQAVVDQLFSLPVEDRVEASKSLDKSGSLGRALRLTKGVAGLAVAGAEARNADKDLVPTKEMDRANQREIFEAQTGGALEGYSVKAQTEILDLARNIYAGTMQHNGKREFDEELFGEAVQMALGRREGRGGVATWHGRGVLLPDWLSAPELGRKLNAFDFSRAAEPATVARRKYTPVLVADDGAVARWRFRDESGAWLGREGGGVYELLMRRAAD